MSDVMLVNANSLSIPLASGSVQMVVTSPPYYGLRDYGTARWAGGNDPGCDHRYYKGGHGEASAKQLTSAGTQGFEYRHTCKRCGAVRQDDQLGLEASPEAYIANMVAVFRECWRVLRPDGTLWLNIGDSYAGSGGAGGDYNAGGRRAEQPKYGGTRRLMKETKSRLGNIRVNGEEVATSQRSVHGCKPKDLIGIPWALAFALRADGWYLRQDLIWHKPNPMPESVTDRCTKAHEYLFLLSKSARYYYDADAIREEYVSADREGQDKPITGFRYDRQGIEGKTRGTFYENAGRNRRSVWTIATSPYAGAHFATFPPGLIEPCIKAGSAPGDIVLDPFAGSGTSLQVARALGRHGVGLDLSLKYLQECARPRLALDAWDAWTEGIPARAGSLEDLPLFGGTL